MKKRLIVIGSGNYSKLTAELVERLSRATGMHIVDINRNIEQLQENMKLTSISFEEISKKLNDIKFQDKKLENEPSKYFGKSKRNYRK